MMLLLFPSLILALPWVREAMFAKKLQKLFLSITTSVLLVPLLMLCKITLQVAAIEEGKIIFNNIKNFLHFQLTTSIAAMGLIAYCSFLDLPYLFYCYFSLKLNRLPLNPTQILWINIIMDGPPAQSLTFEANREAVKLPPRNPHAPIIDRKIIAKVLTSATLMVVGTMWIFLSVRTLTL